MLLSWINLPSLKAREGYSYQSKLITINSMFYLVYILMFLIVASFLKKTVPLISKLIVGLSLCFVAIVELSPLPQYMTKSLENQNPIPSFNKKHNAIVLLGGDILSFNSKKNKIILGRRKKGVLLAIELFNKKNIEYIIITGKDQKFKNIQLSEKELAFKYLSEHGIPKEKILLTENSSNTFQDAIVTKKILGSLPPDNFYLVSTSTHLPRALWSFNQLSLYPTPVPVDSWQNNIPPPFNYSSDYNRYFIFRRFFHEYFGLLYYKRTYSAKTQH